MIPSTCKAFHRGLLPLSLLGLPLAFLLALFALSLLLSFLLLNSIHLGPHLLWCLYYYMDSPFISFLGLSLRLSLLHRPL